MDLGVRAGSTRVSQLDTPAPKLILDPVPANLYIAPAFQIHRVGSVPARIAAPPVVVNIVAENFGVVEGLPDGAQVSRLRAGNLHIHNTIVTGSHAESNLGQGIIILPFCNPHI
jgi:hypothetical protein